MVFSSETTFIEISDCISGCKLIITLKVPSVLISLTGCIKEGFILVLRSCNINFEISVGLTDP